jgi:hypothetical protein
MDVKFWAFLIANQDLVRFFFLSLLLPVFSFNVGHFPCVFCQILVGILKMSLYQNHYCAISPQTVLLESKKPKSSIILIIIWYLIL